jgi:hypothetical protein
MSPWAQQTMLARTSGSRESGPLLATADLRIGAAQLTLDSVAPAQASRRTGCDGRWSAENGVVHPLRAFVASTGSQRQARERRFFCVLVASAYRATGLQQRCFHRAPFLPYFPCFPSVTRFGAYPAPGGTRRSASLRALWVSAFRKSFWPFPQRVRKEKISEPSEKARLRPWERGTLASLRARVSRGNFGQIQTGEKQWHSTKTKSR